MVDDQALKEWFCREVLPLERALSAFIRRNWRDAADVVDLRQDIYERVLQGARHGLPAQAGQFVYTVARNHLINRAKRARIVSFEVIADLDATSGSDVLEPERQLLARESPGRAGRVRRGWRNQRPPEPAAGLQRRERRRSPRV